MEHDRNQESKGYPFADDKESKITQVYMIKRDSANMITVNNLKANQFLQELMNAQYPCLNYIRSHLRQLKKRKFAKFNDKARATHNEDERIRLMAESEQIFVVCIPFYDNLIDKIIEELGPIHGGAMRSWMEAIERFLLANGNEGYADLIANDNLRLNSSQLMGFIRETMKQKDTDIIENDDDFGSFEPDTTGGLKGAMELTLKRAYHAGEGFCIHLRAAPLSHLSYIIRNFIWIDNHMRVHDGDYSYTRILEFLQDHPMMVKQESIDKVDGKSRFKYPSVTILNALDLICKSFEKFPSDVLLKYATDPMKTSHFGSLRKVILDLSEANIQKYNNNDKELAQQAGNISIIKRMTNYLSDKISCSWVQFFLIKRFTLFWFHLGEEYEPTRIRMELPANLFLEKCSLSLLTKHYRLLNKIPMWPQFPDSLLAKHVAIKLQTLPSIEARCDRIVQLLDTRSFGWIQDYANIWLTNPSDLLISRYNAAEKLVKSFANGTGFCEYYKHIPVHTGNGKYLNSIIELMHSMLNLTGFKPSHSNDAISFFYMWRLCKLNALLPIDLNGINLQIR